MSAEYKKLREQLQEVFDFWGEEINDNDTREFKNLLADSLKHTSKFKLYRYTPPKIYNLRSFEKQTIFLSQNGTFNDIYEGIPSDDLNGISNFDLSLLNDSAYIACFSEKHDNLLMWSHYADSHRGFCIEYDLKLLNLNSDILSHIYPVLYHNQRESFPIKDIIESMRELNDSIYKNEVCDINVDKLLTLFTVKGLDWKYEREWRVIYTKKDMYDRSETNSISKSLQILSFPCVSAIYLGYRIDPDIKSNILEIVSRLRNTTKRKIKVYEPFLSNKNYNINFKEVKNHTIP